LPKKGLVHSFTGTVEEMRRLVEMGFHVGVNGCSMKTEENLEVVRAIPLARLQLETDGPWVSRSFFALRRLFFITDPVFISTMFRCFIVLPSQAFRIPLHHNHSSYPICPFRTRVCLRSRNCPRLFKALQLLFVTSLLLSLPHIFPHSHRSTTFSHPTPLPLTPLSMSNHLI